MSSSLRLDHIGIAVGDLEEARRQFARVLGTEPSAIEEVPSEGVRVSFFQVGESRIELLEPTTDASPIQKFLARGRRGVHHVALRIEGETLAAALERLRRDGAPIVGDTAREGSDGSLVAFIHPSATSGVLVEIVQPAEPPEAPSAPDPEGETRG